MKTIMVFLSGSMEPLEPGIPPSGWRQTLTSMLFESRSENEHSSGALPDSYNAPAHQFGDIAIAASSIVRDIRRVYHWLDERIREVRDFLATAMLQAVRADQGRIHTMVSAAYEKALRRANGEPDFPNVTHLAEWDGSRIATCDLLIVHTFPEDPTAEESHIKMAREHRIPILRITPMPSQYRQMDCVASLEEAANFVRTMYSPSSRVR